MKKIILLLFTVFLNVFLFSCSSDDDLEKENTESTEEEDGD